MRAVLSSAKNQRIKDLVHLREKRSHRNERRQFLVEGMRECERALASGLKLFEIYAPQSVEIPHDVEARAESVILIDDTVFDKVAMRSTEIVGVFGFREEALIPRFGEEALVLILDGIEKPGNLGAIFRSADAAGVQAVYIVGEGVDIYNPNVIRSSLGTSFSIPTIVGGETLIAKQLIDQGFELVTATPEAKDDFLVANFAKRTAFVIGSEAHGVGDYWKTIAKRQMSLPMHGLADSLNASVTAALFCYGYRRQYPIVRSL